MKSYNGFEEAPLSLRLIVGVGLCLFTLQIMAKDYLGLDVDFFNV